MLSPILMPKQDNTLMAIIRDLGLTTNLKLCLDAGDPASYTSGQKWLDRSGGGYDFHLGATSGSEASDPTFNGVAGRQSDAEYFSGDGGDYFTYDSNSETWMRDFHRAGAVTVLGLFRVATDASTVLFDIGGTDGIGCGCFYSGPVNKILYYAADNAASPQTIGAAMPDISASIPVLAFWALTTTIGSGNAYTVVYNGTAYTGNWPAFTPSTTSGMTTAPKIGAFTNATTIMPSGTRDHALAMWDDTALSSANLLAIYNRLKLRFPTLP